LKAARCGMSSSDWGGKPPPAWPDWGRPKSVRRKMDTPRPAITYTTPAATVEARPVAVVDDRPPAELIMIIITIPDA